MQHPTVTKPSAFSTGQCTTLKVFHTSSAGTTELVKNNDGVHAVRKTIPVQFAETDVWQSLVGAHIPHMPEICAVTYDPGTTDADSTPLQEALKNPARADSKPQSIPKNTGNLVVYYQYIQGTTVASKLKHEGAFSVDDAYAATRDVACALSALHEKGIIHRDVSAGNVVIPHTTSGTIHAWLIDFGIARKYQDGLSQDTICAGTNGFASPEQYGFMQSDARSDIYALGKLLGAMLTGYLPYESAYAPALASKTVPSDFRRVVEKACAFEPSKRYQNIKQMQSDMDHALLAYKFHTDSNAETPPAESPDAASSQTQTAKHTKHLYHPLRDVALLANDTQTIKHYLYVKATKQETDTHHISYDARILLILVACMFVFGIACVIDSGFSFASVPFSVHVIANEAMLVLLSIWGIFLPTHYVASAIVRVDQKKISPKHATKQVILQTLYSFGAFLGLSCICLAILSPFGM